MLTVNEYIKQSLSLHLFFARIMKEHSFFLQIGFVPKNQSLIDQANAFRLAFDALLADVVSLSNGVVSKEILQSGEIFTPYTLNAEMVSAYYTGVRIQTNITKAEEGLSGDGTSYNFAIEQNVNYVNENAMRLINQLIGFKTTILSSVLSCNLFTANYPLLLDHILREAKFYLQMIQKLQSKEEINLEKEIYEQESFWNRIMAEHAKFIRGLLDPTENDLIVMANAFGNEFDELSKEVQESMDKTIPLQKVTADCLAATTNIRDFKAKGTQGLINCKIKSIIIPLLGDHVLREANHYLRLLNMFEKGV